MKLKTATLIAIIGNLLGFIGGRILNFAPLNWKVEQLNIAYSGIQFLSTGSLILFLSILYMKQK